MGALVAAGAIGKIGLALSALSTVAQLVSQRQANKAAEQRATYEAAVARNNAILQERLAVNVLEQGRVIAEDVKERGTVAEHLQRQEVRGLIGIQRAALAGAGVEVGTGTALDITSDTAAIGEFEAQVTRAETARTVRDVRFQAERAAFEHRTRGQAFGAEAELARLRGFRPDTSLGTVLSGGASILGRFATLKAKGIID